MDLEDLLNDSREDIIEELESIKQAYFGYFEACFDEPYVDVRLNINEAGHFSVLWGDSQNDTDHRGLWGYSTLLPYSDCAEVADELIDDLLNARG